MMVYHDSQTLVSEVQGRFFAARLILKYSYKQKENDLKIAFRFSKFENSIVCEIKSFDIQSILIPLIQIQIRKERIKMTFKDNYSDDTFTPYRVSVILNDILSELGIDKKIPSQMMYNYRKQGMLVTNEDGRISNENAFLFVEKYLNKNFKASLNDLLTEEVTEEVTEEETV